MDKSVKRSSKATAKQQVKKEKEDKKKDESSIFYYVVVVVGAIAVVSGFVMLKLLLTKKKKHENPLETISKPSVHFSKSESSNVQTESRNNLVEDVVSQSEIVSLSANSIISPL